MSFHRVKTLQGSPVCVLPFTTPETFPSEIEIETRMLGGAIYLQDMPL